MKIGSFEIGSPNKPFLIAEISGNHNGDLGRMVELIKLAKNSGADAVKFQTYTPDTMTIDSNKKYFQITEGPWKGSSLYSLYKVAHTPWSWHKEMFQVAKSLNIAAFSTPFDESSVTFLEEFDPPAYKIASFEMSDLGLVSCVAELKKPLIISTGMASIKEIDDVVNTVRRYHNDFILLYCVSAYPAIPSDFNLRAINTFRSRYSCEVGLSDHTLSHTTAITSVALGASVIEKHFTLSRDDGGPDSSFSLEPQEFTQLSGAIQDTWQSLAQTDYVRPNAESPNHIFKRSIFAIKNILAGEKFTSENIKKVRPGYGLPPKYYSSLIGTLANRDIERGEPIAPEDTILF
jgi:pseudaminic acid synthase